MRVQGHDEYADGSQSPALIDDLSLILTSSELNVELRAFVQALCCNQVQALTITLYSRCTLNMASLASDRIRCCTRTRDAQYCEDLASHSSKSRTDAGFIARGVIQQPYGSKRHTIRNMLLVMVLSSVSL
jgi:hypothetical protein